MPGGGILLKPGHCGGGVVENDDDVPGFRTVVRHFNDSGETAVKESAVADHADDFAGLFFRERTAQTESEADTGAHADAHVDCAERRKRAERVTADVASDDAAEVAQSLEGLAVRTSRAELRGTSRNRRRIRREVAVKLLFDAVDVEFAEEE